MTIFNKVVTRGFRAIGFKLIKLSKSGDLDILNDPDFMALYSFCKPFTMTSMERMYSLYLSVKHIIDLDIPGDFVECGVWKGGSSMLIASYLQRRGINDRKIYMYDTFEGMNTPTDKDKDLTGESAFVEFNKQQKGEDSSYWCYSSLDEVKHNMDRTKFPQENIVYVKGKVEDTIPRKMPEGDICLLRLDTDWYDSTKHELVHLYPRLISSGILIIDDFGHWQGAKKAVLEYFEENKIQLLLNRIDYTGRIGIKP